VHRGRILGKPADAEAGLALLLELQDDVHEVLTAVSVRRDDWCATRIVSSQVRFRSIDVAEAAAYVATGEGADKAGGYGIQGIGAIFVAMLSGSYSNVVGLPLAETEALLRAAGVDTWGMRSASSVDKGTT
jgi:septum formation protein